MIKSIDITSFGPIKDFHYDGFGNINLLIGKNGTGKTFFLKALYAALKTVEQYKRGKEPRSQKQLLADSLYWTFQAKALGDLVRKNDTSLLFIMHSDSEEVLSYTFGNSTVSTILSLNCTYRPTDVNHIFIPAKEIVSIQNIILRTYDMYKSFGFDKTYVDLARAMGYSHEGGAINELAEARDSLASAMGGQMEFDNSRQEWVFREKDRKVIDVNLVSEGIKHLSILDLLLRNHYLSNHSVILIDEAEANLHPGMIGRFMEILMQLAEEGMQIFLSTHSYFVIKNLYVLAHKRKISVPTVSFEEGKVVASNLLNEMPDNPIIQESIDLYKREIQL